ncbi:MAG: Ig-like domain-containing protein, partial [Thermoguttaceae bacterium]
MFSRNANRRPGNPKRRHVRPEFSARFEQLEDRTLLATNVLASLTDGNIADVGATNDLTLTIDPGGAPIILGFLMKAAGAEPHTLDPAAPRMELGGVPVTPLYSRADRGADGSESLLLAKLAPGQEYTVVVGGEQGTTGAYEIDVFLPGDLNQDGRVDDFEKLYCGAAVVQQQFGGNHVSALFYKMQGIDMSQDLYRPELDANLNGRIDNFDLTVAEWNANLPVVNLELIGDDDAPLIQVGLENDTGRSQTDGITSNATIAGTITDASEIVSLQGSIDAGAAVDLLSNVAADGSFQLDPAQLEQIAGASLANNGQHTLHLVAEDELGNATLVPVDVTFELDTIAPAALDLTDASDTGTSNIDNLTNDNTPTISADAETSAIVELLSSVQGPIGSAVANSPVSITTDLLSDGAHSITATATDVAGNASTESDPITVTIDTTPPAVPTLGLAVASDTGVLGDGLTALTLVTLEGQTSPNMDVQAVNTTTAANVPALSDAAGGYSFAAMLEFGQNHFEVAVTDAAG